MKKIYLCSVVVICLAAARLFTGIAGAGEVEKGKAIYTNKCQMCHGADAKGNGPAASAFNPRPYDLTTADFWNSDAEKKIRGAIVNGFGAMPPIDLAPEQSQAVIDYMEHAFKK